MKPLKTAPIAACFCVAFAQISVAQSDSGSRRSEIGLAIGLAQAAQMNATASPLQFGGRGFDVAAHFLHVGSRLTLSASIDGGVQNLTPDESHVAADEQSNAAQLRLGIRHVLGPANSSFDLGLDLTSTAALTVHHYNDPTHSISDFLFGTATLGPSADWHHGLFGGSARVDLTVPVVGYVDHPYSDARTTPDHIDARLVSLNALHGADAGATYSTSANRALGIEWSYRLHMLHYDDAQPLRAVSQTVSIGLVRRFGGGDR